MRCIARTHHYRFDLDWYVLVFVLVLCRFIILVDFLYLVFLCDQLGSLRGAYVCIYYDVRVTRTISHVCFPDFDLDSIAACLCSYKSFTFSVHF